MGHMGGMQHSEGEMGHMGGMQEEEMRESFGHADMEKMHQQGQEEEMKEQFLNMLNKDHKINLILGLNVVILIVLIVKMCLKK